MIEKGGVRMKSLRPVVISIVVIYGLALFAAAQNQQGGSPQPQSQPSGQPQTAPNQPSQGQMNPQGQPGKGPCHQDVQQFCQGVQPGQGRIINCLKQNHDQL